MNKIIKNETCQTVQASPLVAYPGPGFPAGSSDGGLGSWGPHYTPVAKISFWVTSKRTTGRNTTECTYISLNLTGDFFFINTYFHNKKRGR